MPAHLLLDKTHSSNFSPEKDLGIARGDGSGIKTLLSKLTGQSLLIGVFGFALY